MHELKGTVVSDGIVRGEAFVLSSSEIEVPERTITEGREEREAHRFERAIQQVRNDIVTFKAESEEKLGEMSGVIDTYLAYLNDKREIVEPIKKLIREERWSAPSAVARHFADIIERFKSLPEPLPSRIPDLRDIRRRLLERLMGRQGGTDLAHLPRRVIVIADDLTPTQTASLDRQKVLGFATDRGGPASHTAILARHLGIPAIVGLGEITKKARPGDTILLDGLRGRVTVDPDEETVRQFQAMRKRRTRIERRLTLEGKGAVTRDGELIAIQGNIDVGEGARELRDLGIAGVGLFRTEFLYLGRRTAPGEADQAQIYRQLLELMAPHPVTIRTMDFGADKFDHRVGIQPEPNPFLGMRAIRLSFEHEDLFRTQLRAILQASVAGKARVLFPMITDVGEFRRARGILRDVMSDLEREGIPFDSEIEVGAMVEMPAAALNAKNLLREADFLSLGTNDLTQYTLAVDRTNHAVAPLFKPHHPSVLELIRMTAEACREAGKSISACGEMAGSRRYSLVLVGLGVTTLSMAGPRMSEVVHRLRRVKASRCRDLAAALLRGDDAETNEGLLNEFLTELPRR